MITHNKLPKLVLTLITLQEGMRPAGRATAYCNFYSGLILWGRDPYLWLSHSFSVQFISLYNETLQVAIVASGCIYGFKVCQFNSEKLI